jgi:hypothetical protein
VTAKHGAYKVVYSYIKGEGNNSIIAKRSFMAFHTRKFYKYFFTNFNPGKTWTEQRIFYKVPHAIMHVSRA